MPLVERIKVQNLTYKLDETQWPADNASDQALVDLLLARAKLRDVPTSRTTREFRALTLDSEHRWHLRKWVREHLKQLEVQITIVQVGENHRDNCPRSGKATLQIVSHPSSLFSSI